MLGKRNKNADILLLAKEALPIVDFISARICRNTVDIIGKDSASEERIAKISTVDFELNLYSGASPEQITALLAGMKRC